MEHPTGALPFPHNPTSPHKVVAQNTHTHTHKSNRHHRATDVPHAATSETLAGHKKHLETLHPKTAATLPLHICPGQERNPFFLDRVSRPPARPPGAPVSTRGVRWGRQRAHYPPVTHVRLGRHVGAREQDRPLADVDTGAEHHAVADDLANREREQAEER